MPRRTSVRGSLSFGFLVAAGLMVLSSAAFACTVYRGTMTVTSSGGGTSTAEGSDTGMFYCPNKDPRLVAHNGQASEVAEHDDANGLLAPVTITVAPGTSCNSSQLAPGNYTVSWNSDFAVDCMAQVGGFPQYIDPKPFVVKGDPASGTSDPQSYNLPALGTGQPGGYAGVCLTSTTQSGVIQGNKAPLRII